MRIKVGSKVFLGFFCSQRLKLEKSGKVIECAYSSLHISCPAEPHSRMTLCHCSCSQQIQIWNSLCIFSLTAGRAVRTWYAILIPSHGCQLCWREGEGLHCVLKTFSWKELFSWRAKMIVSPYLAFICRVHSHFTLSDLLTTPQETKVSEPKRPSLNFREWNYPAFSPVSYTSSRPILITISISLFDILIGTLGLLLLCHNLCIHTSILLSAKTQLAPQVLSELG